MPAVETTNLILKAKRVEMGLSITDMAQMINMDIVEYSAREDNVKEFKLKSMVRISKITGMSMDELFNWRVVTTVFIDVSFFFGVLFGVLIGAGRGI